MNYQWNLSCGQDRQSGQATDIAHAIDALRRALGEMAETSAEAEVDGVVTGPGDDMPFWMRWHPLTPTGNGEPDRDIPGTRATIAELAESLRDELHWMEDRLALAG